MATLQGSGVPRVKVEGPTDQTIKPEPDDDAQSQYMDEDDDMDDEDAGDLDFSSAQQQMWLALLPRSLWETLANLQDNDEIELGTIRIEGSESNPSRVSLMLNKIPQLSVHPKEYNLCTVPAEKLRSRKPGQALVFSERDRAGYKGRKFTWDAVDEDGNPGQGRSKLYEKHKKEVKKKENRENKTRWTPYVRRSIPKHTAVAGVVTKEYEAVPVKNQEFFVTEGKQTAMLLKQQERPQAVFAMGNNDPSRRQMPFMSMTDRANVNKNAQARRQAAKDNRAARVDKSVLIDKLLDLFKLHRIWGLRDLKARVNQPESYLRATLDEIAFMWKHGDFNGKWELKEEYKQKDAELMNPASEVAPKAEDSDMDKSGMDDDEEDDFEDV